MSRRLSCAFDGRGKRSYLEEKRGRDHDQFKIEGMMRQEGGAAGFTLYGTVEFVSLLICGVISYTRHCIAVAAQLCNELVACCPSLPFLHLHTFGSRFSVSLVSLVSLHRPPAYHSLNQL